MSKERKNPALDKLNNEVAAILDSDTWRAALALKSKMHKYSWNNLLLIHLQRPDATMVAGYGRWQELKRQVRKGERGIAILAPVIVPVKDEDDNKTGATKLVGFRTAYVFDVSQTDGEELPTIPRPQLLSGGGDDACQAVTLLEQVIAAEGSTLIERTTEELGGALGSFTPLTGDIRISSDLEPLQRAKTLAHELAHAVLHGKDGEHTDYDLGELEAETTAYLVMDALGLDTGSYSFSYLAGWTQTPENLKRLLDAGYRATKAADQIVASMQVLQEPDQLAA